MTNTINITMYQISFEAMEDALLSTGHGSMLRGLLGNALREGCCTQEAGQKCETCHRQDQCIYSKLFNGISLGQSEDSASIIKAQKLPNPYVIQPISEGSKHYKKGDQLDFLLTLIGENTLQYAAYFLMAFKQVEARGLGSKRYRFKLKSVSQYQSGEFKAVAGYLHPLTPIQLRQDLYQDEIYKGRIKINILTPLRVKEKGKFASQLSFELLIKNILRRATLLISHYETAYQPIDVGPILEEARRIQVVSDESHWVKQERMSEHKQQRMSLGGIKGTVIYQGEFALTRFWLELGTYINIGKACTNGDGWITYEYD